MGFKTTVDFVPDEYMVGIADTSLIRQSKRSNIYINAGMAPRLYILPFLSPR